MRNMELILTKSLHAELLSPKHYRPISLIKQFFQLPCQGSISCQAHACTHMGFQTQQSQAMPALLQKGSLQLSSAWWPSDAKYTKPFLLRYFTESCSHPWVRISSRGRMVLSQGSKISITHFFSRAEKGFWKHRSSRQAVPLQHQNINTPACVQNQSAELRCLHYIIKLTLSLCQFLKLTSNSSQQTQSNDADNTLPWKETGDQLWLV